MNNTNQEIIKNAVRERYGAIASGQASTSTTADKPSSCCQEGASCGCETAHDTQARTLGYSADEVAAAPQGANLGLGCGNPLAIASLLPGQTVLDLGSGAGFDAFLAARAVGPGGHVIGVDMTHEMLAKARANARKGDYAHVEFRLGEIEALPVADGIIDVIISNCVINLCPDKRPVYREAFRVLKPGGRLAVSDVVSWAPLEEDVRNNLALHSGCLAGATPHAELRAILEEAGFADIVIRPKSNTAEIIGSWNAGEALGHQVFAAEVLATKPVSCCKEGNRCCA